MNVVQAIEQLLHHFLDLAQTELHVHVGQQTSQIVLTEIKDQVKGGPVPICGRSLGAADLDEINDILVLQQLQDADLTQSRDWEL